MRLFFTTLLSLFVALTASAETPSAGMWKATFSSEMKVPGIPMPPQSQSVEYCLSEEDAKDPKKAAGLERMAAEGCTVEKYEQLSNSLSAQVICTQAGQRVVTKVTVDYTATTFSGSGTADLDMGSMKANVLTRFNGKRIGECS